MASAWVAAHPRGVWLSLRGALPGLLQGGTVVGVPPGDAPVVWTLVQPDGDYVTSVRWERVALLDQAARDALVIEHRNALARCRPPLDLGLAQRLASLSRVTGHMAWAMPLAASGGSAWWSGGLMAELLACWPVLAGALLPLAARLPARRLVRHALRRAGQRLRADPP